MNNDLSDRLRAIADRISKGETMADIGTDHGFLPIYLVEKGISPMAIMADVSAQSLEKGRKNAHMLLEDADLINKLDFRVGDGLKVLGSGEVDTVVIAGMGGKLIRDIMAADYEHTLSFDKFVLQPRIGQGHLRKWLSDNGFAIVNEAVVKEGRHIPEIITALSPKNENTSVGIQAGYELASSDGDDIAWKIPPWMTKADGPLEEFIARNLALTEEKLSNVRKARARDTELEEKIIGEINYLKNFLKEQ